MPDDAMRRESDGLLRAGIEDAIHALTHLLKQTGKHDLDDVIRRVVPTVVPRLHQVLRGEDPYGTDAEGQASTPYVAIGAGERAPWADLDLNCPECGAGPLELQDSDPPGLTYISHCGKSWLRGQPNFDAIFGRDRGTR